MVRGGVRAAEWREVSSIILFMVAGEEGDGVVNNTPVTYYR